MLFPLLLLFAMVGAPASPAIAAPARAAAGAAHPSGLDPSLLHDLEWRLVGPFRGGRATAITGVRGRPNLFYMGACGGGVWRSTNSGVSWESISDSAFGTGSVGAIGVAPSDPNVLYVGMGEVPVRGNVSHGDGVYRSTDAGRSWRHMGLADTRQIGRVRVHPQNPDLVYVAALGHLFGPNTERGVFRSRDGGTTWQRVLHVDDRTGCVDLCFDPTNPRILYAGFWQVVRRPWSFESGGPGSGLYKSTDGGDSWQRLTGPDPSTGRPRDNGLPKGVLGKICVTVSAARPERVWAMIEAEDGGLFRSDDGGGHWTRVNDERKLRQRAWYFSRVYADPKNADVVYVLNVQFHRSQDGGRTFTAIRLPHPDHHDLWIDPDSPEIMAESNDGGATITRDGGVTWSTLDNQPTAQFYHVITDSVFPYRIYGSQQDNSTVSIPSRTTGYGIEAEDWWDVGGGESGYIAPSPLDNNIVFAGSYGGYLTRYDRRTGQQRDVNVYPDNPMGHGAEGMKYRFQWTFPIVISPHDPNRIYAGANILFRTGNEGQTWEAMSPDLTRADPAKLGPSGGPITKDNTSVEYYATIFTVAESRVQKGVLWAGSDDGLIHVTRDDGASWQNVTPPGLPEAMVSLIEAGPHAAGTAYAAINRYKFDDFRPYLYRTTDFGRSWTSITRGLPPTEFVRAVREDPERPGLLYAGTEAGFYVSFDAGGSWQRLNLNLPVVPITDIAVRGADVVVATQGRAFWVLDDVSPLRQWTPAVAREATHLFAPRPAVRMAGVSVPRRDTGRNPPTGAVLRYWLAAAPPDSVPLTLEILDASGTLIRKFDRKGEVPDDTLDVLGRPLPPGGGAKLPAEAGLNVFEWDLRHRAARRVDGMILWGGQLDGPVAVPGRYQARLTLGKGEPRLVPLTVGKDPHLPAGDDDFRRQFELLVRLRETLSETHDAIVILRDVREQVDGLTARAKRIGKAGALADSAKSLTTRLSAIEEALYQVKSKSEQDPLNFPIRLNNKLALLAETVASADTRPTDQSYEVERDLTARIRTELDRLRLLLTRDLPAFNRQVIDAGVPAVMVREGSPAR